MHYNVEGRQSFGVRWQPALPKPGEGGSAAATPLWAERSDGAFSNGRSLSSGLLCKVCHGRATLPRSRSRFASQATGSAGASPCHPSRPR